MLLIVISLTVLNFVFTESAHDSKAYPVHTKKDNDVHGLLSTSSATKYKPPGNFTYNYNHDNILHVPKIHYDNEYKRKILKKAPKSTIQKIIKTKHSKKRLSHSHVTKPTTKVTESEEIDVIETTQPSTTQVIRKKNLKRKHPKKKFVPRLPNPFLKFKRDQKGLQYRLKRDTGVTDREFYIFQDLDEVKFISGEDRNNDEIVAHIKNYWK